MYSGVMASLQEIVISQPCVWSAEDQRIFEWMFPSLAVTPECPKPAKLPTLRRTRALSSKEWDEVLSVV